MRISRVVLGLWLMLCAVAASAELRLEEGYVRGLPPGQSTTAAFMRLVNTGDQSIVIDSGNSSAAARVEIHAHVHKGGMMSMRQLPSITVPAEGEFILAPGEHHLMLIGLTKALQDGETVTLQLFSGNTEVVAAELPVRSVLKEHRH